MNEDPNQPKQPLDEKVGQTDSDDEVKEKNADADDSDDQPATQAK